MRVAVHLVQLTIDSCLDNVEREERRGHNQRNGEAASNRQDLAQAESCCGVCHVREYLRIVDRDILVLKSLWLYICKIKIEKEKRKYKDCP